MTRLIKWWRESDRADRTLVLIACLVLTLAIVGTIFADPCGQVRPCITQVQTEYGLQCIQHGEPRTRDPAACKEQRDAALNQPGEREVK